MMTIAIDPGVKGAYAVSPRENQPRTHASLFAMDLDKLATLLKAVGSPHAPYPTQVVVEKLTGTGQGVPMALGQNYGEILGMCRANGINPIMVPPQVWQRPYKKVAGVDYEARKKALHKIAGEMIGGRILKPYADAYLILQWAYALSEIDRKRYTRCHGES